VGRPGEGEVGDLAEAVVGEREDAEAREAREHLPRRRPEAALLQLQQLQLRQRPEGVQGGALAQGAVLGERQHSRLGRRNEHDLGLGSENTPPR